MKTNTEILIVGAGPSGLMMACQLLRFGVSFRIIDQQADRTYESRAFGIQAKSMEIFQNLGIVDEFLKKAAQGGEAKLFVKGKLKLVLKLNQVKLENTPFSSIFFLPQSETERILIEYIEKKGAKIERRTRLENFVQTPSEVNALLKNTDSGAQQEVTCQYIVGCDGAHSTVRGILDIPFVGADYEQSFFLADTTVQWPNAIGHGLMMFFDQEGFFLHAPLSENLSRIIGANIRSLKKHPKSPLTLPEIENLAKKITHMPIIIENPIWMTRFYLHHRVVKQYRKERGFLVGDAAHIHSPVGAQGMNTGLQDATNLAWKLTLVLKNKSIEKILDSYQLERQLIGEKLTHTTDRFFRLLTSSNKLLRLLRPFILTILMKIVSTFTKVQQKMFWLMSQLEIHYPENNFIEEELIGADAKFLAGPKAGFRAPDAPLKDSTLFELLKDYPFNVLIFQNTDKNQNYDDDVRSQEIEKNNIDLIKFHKIKQSDKTKIIFDRYGIATSGIYFIRPDGYIGFRSCNNDQVRLLHYLSKFFNNQK